MTNQSPVTNTLSVMETAKHLSKSLGKTTAYWTVWLANDRKPSRVNRKLPVQFGLGRPKYDTAVIGAFVHEALIEKQQHQSTSPGKPNERQFAPHISPVMTSQSGEASFVLLVTVSPLAAYKLTAAQARQIAKRLMQAAEVIEEES